MRNIHRQLRRLGQLSTAAVLLLAFVSPAAAQFGGLKKKVRAAAGAEAADKTPADTPAAPTATAPGGGAVVLTPEIVNQLVTGLKAGEAARQAALTEDTPYARYLRDTARWNAVKETCQAAQATFPNRLAADEKKIARYQGYLDRMAEAQRKGDQKLVMAWEDSSLAMQDASCLVREPTQPDDFYQAQRAIDSRAEQTAVKESGLSQSEFAMARERGEGILRNAPPPDVSPGETSAVQSRGAELKPLLGIRDAPAARAMKATPSAPAPAPAAAESASATVPPGASAMNQCIAQNAKKHEKEIAAMGERAKAAQEAGDMPKVMAIADTLQRLQLAGCQGGR
jgi:hypothetical protein